MGQPSSSRAREAESYRVAQAESARDAGAQVDGPINLIEGAGGPAHVPARRTHDWFGIAVVPHGVVALGGMLVNGQARG
ncbi:hypothetical protein [Propioniciclava flava]